MKCFRDNSDSKLVWSLFYKRVPQWSFRSCFSHSVRLTISSLFCIWYLSRIYLNKLLMVFASFSYSSVLSIMAISLWLRIQSSWSLSSETRACCKIVAREPPCIASLAVEEEVFRESCEGIFRSSMLKRLKLLSCLVSSTPVTAYSS